MSIENYKWLIVGEGNVDVERYTELLKQFGTSQSDFHVMYAGIKSNVFRLNDWNRYPTDKNRVVSQKTLENDQGRYSFEGVILVVDSDQNQSLAQNYAGYSPECRSQTIAYEEWQQPQLVVNTSVMLLDTIKGINGRKLPIYGLCVPTAGPGCLETDLLKAYGYPVPDPSDEAYDTFAYTIKAASQSWGVEKSSDGNEWWEPSRNGKARMDKFMYVALTQGFLANQLKTKQIAEPQIITDIKNAMNLPGN